MRFDDLGLSPEVIRAVADAGYTEPTPIQEKAIPIALQGRDLLGVAQTGTGKTAAFTLPMIDILAGGQAKARMPRSLIIAPTRELATQISENFEIYGKYHPLTMALLIGGVSSADQERALDRGVDVLIATPGRFLDLHERGKILLAGVKILVIDEADRMLDMGFIPDVERIVAMLSPLRQTLFFAATMGREIRRLADAFLHNPKEASVDPPASPAEMVSHAMARVGARDKGKALRTLLAGEQVKNALIFCNRKSEVDILNRSLKRDGFGSAALHGDMPQPARTETLEAFKRGDVRFLVATDVAGRGIDIFGLSHVFNFDVPTHAEDYIHRIGRTGRAGHRGRAIMLATADDARFVAAIKRLIGRDIPSIEIDGIAHPSADAGEEEAAAPSRRADSRRGGRGGRSRTRGAPRAAAGRDRAKAPTPVEPPAGSVVDRPSAEDRSSAADRSSAVDRSSAAERPSKAATEAKEGPSQAAPPAKDKPRKAARGDAKAKRPRKAVAEAEASSAFGAESQVPAFLRRPARPRGS
jgi:superfamily II DNA/RNA helicase